MKLNKLFILGGIAAASMSLSSCVGDLDLTPTDPNTINPGNFSEDPEAYMRSVFADVYLNMSTWGPNGSNMIVSGADGGMFTFQRAVFNLEEVPTDEANWQPTSDAIPNSLSYGVAVPSETYIYGAYQRMMMNATLCNDFIQSDFDLKTAEQEALREEFVRQAKILRSGMYFYLISDFGNVPYNDESVRVGEIPPQLSTDFATGRRMVTENVVNTLEEIVAWYKANDPNNNPPYGYVGLDVAESLLVKFYLNYEVFTGTAAWDKCLSHAQAVISRRAKGGFNNSGLAKNYAQTFAYNNYEGDAATEIIWRLPMKNSTQDPQNMGIESYANGNFMLNGFIGDSPATATFHCTQAEYNSGNGWKCMSARRQFVEVFDWNADYSVSPDQRTNWWKTAKDGFNINNDDLTQPEWGNNGFLPVKFTNWYIEDDGTVNAALSPEATSYVGIDYGMIRLAEIYLSAAEAILHGAGNASQAVTYVNYVRERAGMPAYTTIDLLELRKERQRELYTECTRRTDLIRYGQWISGYTWNWKGQSKEGHDFPASFIIYPLPSTVVTLNGYVQNPGY